MGKNTKKFNKELFKGTHKYYAKYRPGIPEEVINIIIRHFDIKPSDRILDIGCGTGQVALAMEGKCGEMVCIDPDPEMLKQAKKATKNCKMKVAWFNSDSGDLEKIKEEVGIFKLAMICRAFHWMDQKKVLEDLNNLITEDGGIAIFGDGSFWTGNEKWQETTKNIIQKYLGEKRCAGKGKFREHEELWEDILARSMFKYVNTHNVPIVRNWNIESIIGYLFSTSFAASHLFGDQLDKFKKEIKTTLLTLNSEGVFQENAAWTIILGKKT